VRCCCAQAARHTGTLKRRLTGRATATGASQRASQPARAGWALRIGVPPRGVHEDVTRGITHARRCAALAAAAAREEDLGDVASDSESDHDVAPPRPQPQHNRAAPTGRPIAARASEPAVRAPQWRSRTRVPGAGAGGRGADGSGSGVPDRDEFGALADQVYMYGASANTAAAARALTPCFAALGCCVACFATGLRRLQRCCRSARQMSCTLCMFSGVSGAPGAHALCAGEIGTLPVSAPPRRYCCAHARTRVASMLSQARCSRDRGGHAPAPAFLATVVVHHGERRARARGAGLRLLAPIRREEGAKRVVCVCKKSHVPAD
jgi:hypothetical protein